MMSTTEPAIPESVLACRPRLPLHDLIEAVNRLYHASEARDYDGRHDEIRVQLPGVWKEMIDVAVNRSFMDACNILDFGCGTGFATEQLLQGLPPSRTFHLTCYDPSPEMLARCRARVAPAVRHAEFLSDFAALLATDRRFDLLATNSVLHHLPDPLATLRQLSSLLTPGAVWLAGHEPSGRFHRNAACCAAYTAFLKERNWRRLLSPGAYLAPLKKMLRRARSPARAAADEAFRQGLFEVKPSPAVITRLVDFHVPHKHAGRGLEGGFDYEVMQEQLAGRWQLLWVKSYSFMGRFYEGRLPRKWRRVCRQLAGQHPMDGSNFSAVWLRVAGNIVGP